MFGDSLLGADMENTGLGDFFKDLPDDYLFEGISKEAEGEAESSTWASVKEEPENIILGNVSSDPYIDYLYAHKYIDALGQDVTSLHEVIVCWFDKKKDWTPSPPVVKDAWSNVCYWLYDKARDIYLVKRMNGKVEYYKRPRDFCTMPKVDIRSINKAIQGKAFFFNMHYRS
ncbi:hypothetical protein E3N88_25946 [Mikania micrantha]|uniref:Uncharacterized protein n=1 Tax=Mikania micrantha TaxID=192012 RepID=A0A5N6N6P4_9ASTR|nr:hypothetical protein E3N88_25946 [Mikania micrantha]